MAGDRRSLTDNLDALADVLVFGKRAGEHAAAYADTLNRRPRPAQSDVQAAVDTVLAPLNRSVGENPYTLQQDLQAVEPAQTFGELGRALVLQAPQDSGGRRPLNPLELREAARCQRAVVLNGREGGHHRRAELVPGLLSQAARHPGDGETEPRWKLNGSWRVRSHR